MMTKRKQVSLSGFDRIRSYFLDNFQIILLIMFFLVAQFIFASSPFVNFEQTFVAAAEKMADDPLGVKMSDFEFYVGIFANPLLTSVVISIGIFFFGSSEFVARMPIILISALFLLFVYHAAKRLFSKRVAFYCSIFMAVNPLFWNWGGMAYSDVLFCFLVAVSFSFVYLGVKTSRMRFFWGGALFLSLSFLTKYVASPFFVFVFFFILIFNLKKSFQESSKSWMAPLKNASFLSLKQFSPFLILFIVLCGSYVFLVVDTFGFLIHPRHSGQIFWQGTFMFARNFLAAFGGYLVWFGAFCGLVGIFSVENLRKRFGNVRFFFIAGFLILMNFLFLVFVYFPVGELDFGFIEAVIPSQLFFVIHIFLILLGELIVLDIFLVTFGSHNKRLVFSIMRWLVIFTLVFFSLVRPTQRYILVLLPIFALYSALICFQKARFRMLRKTAFVVTVALFFIVCIFISVYKFNLGVASMNIANFINENELNSGIDWEPRSHSYYLLKDQELYPSENIYIVIENKTRPYYTGPTSRINQTEYQIIYSQPVTSFGIKLKEFSVGRKKLQD